ncbi:unnamed protein product [Brugia pahangi]|uniref:Thionin-like protein 2 n=1 Tax=Brugia pahangi TaxID=6280 RepID=A0A0N4TVE0_BRUPA|nr:unnamed protein product [Brugia pahangi]
MYGNIGKHISPRASNPEYSQIPANSVCPTLFPCITSQVESIVISLVAFVFIGLSNRERNIEHNCAVICNCTANCNSMCAQQCQLRLAINTCDSSCQVQCANVC